MGEYQVVPGDMSCFEPPVWSVVDSSGECKAVVETEGLASKLASWLSAATDLVDSPLDFNDAQRRTHPDGVFRAVLSCDVHSLLRQNTIGFPEYVLTRLFACVVGGHGAISYRFVGAIDDKALLEVSIQNVELFENDNLDIDEMDHDEDDEESGSGDDDEGREDEGREDETGDDEWEDDEDEDDLESCASSSVSTDADDMPEGEDVWTPVE